MFNFFYVLISFVVFVQKLKSQNVPGVCICVPTGTCGGNPVTPLPGTGSDGTGQIVSNAVSKFFAQYYSIT